MIIQLNGCRTADTPEHEFYISGLLYVSVVTIILCAKQQNKTPKSHQNAKIPSPPHLKKNEFRNGSIVSSERRNEDRVIQQVVSTHTTNGLN